MKLKTCTCGKHQTTKNSQFLSRMDDILWFNCLSCRSTFVLVKKARKKNTLPLTEDEIIDVIVIRKASA